MRTKLLKFPFDAKVNGEILYKAGEVYDVPVESGSADRWIRRGAIEVKQAENAETISENIDTDTSLDPQEEIVVNDDSNTKTEDAETHSENIDAVVDTALDPQEEIVVNDDSKKENKKGNKNSSNKGK